MEFKEINKLNVVFLLNLINLILKGIKINLMVNQVKHHFLYKKLLIIKEK
jgi:hypothetical protein